MKPCPTIIVKIGESDAGGDAVDVSIADDKGKPLLHLTASGDFQALVTAIKPLAARFLPKDAAKP